MRQHLGVWGKAPAGVQRAAPSGARRVGGLSGEERRQHFGKVDERERFFQSRAVPSADFAGFP